MKNDVSNHFRYVEPQDKSLNPKYHCVFCQDKRHSSHLCKKFKRNEEFYDVVVKQKRCKNCLKQFHRSEQCYDDKYCAIKSCNRKDKHSPCVCRQRFPKSVWSELYHLNISSYKENNAERSPTPIWTELYRRNISEFSSEKKLDMLNQKDCGVNTSCMTVTTLQSERKFASVETQTDDEKRKFASVETQTDDEKRKFATVETQTEELCSKLPSITTHHLEESRRNSSFVNVPEHERFQSIVFNYLEILCSIYHNWGVQNSFFVKPKIPCANFSPTKDYFMDILT